MTVKSREVKAQRPSGEVVVLEWSGSSVQADGELSRQVTETTVEVGWKLELRTAAERGQRRDGSKNKARADQINR